VPQVGGALSPCSLKYATRRDAEQVRPFDGVRIEQISVSIGALLPDASKLVFVLRGNGGEARNGAHSEKVDRLFRVECALRVLIWRDNFSIVRNSDDGEAR
jgi:hypothetical protein